MPIQYLGTSEYDSLDVSDLEEQPVKEKKLTKKKKVKGIHRAINALCYQKVVEVFINLY